ncbi:putative LPS assembly protein LptD [Proteiniphilum sp.]|uniref:putative LPS assembly protein LptD n=1 Tax=Proteiniphilum sp. TaxID=1926877 RepID=UPI002B211C96|nr:putative LPS assembly protein LptD [Proteiniphilum sp.]MEA4916008.1 putative LPS assembly protein LptD [Proteiniphilum sp.]
MRQLLRYILIYFVLILFLQNFFAFKAVAAASPAVRTVSLGSIPYPDMVKGFSYGKETIRDTIGGRDIGLPIVSTDSLKIPRPQSTSSQPDSLTAKPDTITKKQVLETSVFYTAKDSMVFTGNNMGFLYGDSDVKYGNLAIKGEFITMDLDSNIISSTFGVDSTGKEFGYPVFSEGGMEYEMKKVRYNFETRKAFIHNVVTQQGEGNIVANEAKMNPDNSFYMRNAMYTTCDHHANGNAHPHFYLNLSKAKVRPEKDVVTGPAWLVVADVPLFPVVLPFAFFPFTKTYSSGIIMPSYGDEMTRGFYLQNGGYYFALSDYIDLALTGEIYTKGSWGAGIRSNYRKRYKYSGNLNMYYLNTVTGEKELKKVVPDAYSEAKDLRINWTHSQDPKANMYRTLSASVNFSTSKNNHRDLSRLYKREASNNTKSSSVNLTQRFPDSPWSMSATMSVNQVSRDSTIAATLPNLSINMSRVSPFKRKNMVGSERWYEKISMSYSGEFRNSITTKEDKFLKANIIKDWTNGMRHNIPVTATFTLLDFIQISPSFNYNERWYTGAHKQAWDPIAKRHVVVDTIHGLKRVYDYSTSISAQTKLYGMYTPWKVFGDKVQAIRHVFSPSVSLSYRPDFGDPRYNFFETYSYKNEYGEDVEYTYSPYSTMMFGTAPTGQSGNINFDFKNNLEMKVLSDKDSTGVRKISLIDDLGISFGYNMMADSMKWSDINTNVRLKLSKSYTLSLNAIWDPYLYELDHNGAPQRVDKLRVFNGRGFGKLKSTGTSFSYSLNKDTFKKLFNRGDKSTEKEEEPDKSNLPDDGTMGANPYEEGGRRSMMSQSDESAGEFDSDGYLKNDINWNISINYSLRYSYGEFNKERLEYEGKLTHNFGLSGSMQPTKNWNLTFNTDYNFDQKKFTNINCTLTRNLHCWNMSASFIPIGPYKSYNFTIRAESSLLQDLKWEQRSSPYDRGASWY